MEKKSINLTQEQIDTLFMGLRYLELHHPPSPEIKIDYRKIYSQIHQISLFPLKETPKSELSYTY